MSVVAVDAVRALRIISEDVCEDVFKPPPRLTVSEWADANRILPQTSAEPGRWRTDRVPYLREIMDTLGDEKVRSVVFVKSAQIGGTSAGENFIAYLIDQAPCGILMLWPTEKKLRSWSRKQLDPLLKDSDCLAAKFPESGRRDSSNTIAAKEFPGGFLQMLTAKSTSDLRSTSARVGIVEEVDEIDAEVGDQGDPLEQFDARFRTFWNSKVYKVSTPTLEGSRVWGDWEKSTQHRYHVPCPHCGHRQVLRWRDGTDDQDEAGAYRLLWEEDEDGEVIPGTAAYLCEGEDCGALIEEHHKMTMLLAGEWIPEHPGRYTVGFHINTLYSPLCSWDDVARAFLKAKNSPATMQTFVNLWLGLPYRQPGSQIDAHYLSLRAESYGDDVDVPHGVGVVVAGVDVQGDRLEMFRWGFGHDEEAWFIGWEVFEGDPGQDEVWKALDKRLQEPLRHASGAPVPTMAACVDAGYQTERVHKFCDARNLRHVVAVVGRPGRPRKLIEAPQARKYRRRNNKRPTHVVGSDTGKDQLASRLRLKRRDDGSTPPGYIHFPDNVDPAFYDGLTAERLVTVYKAGRPTRVWKAIDGRVNEPTDGAVYAMAALQLLTMRRVLDLRNLGAMAKKYSEWKAEPKPAKRPAGGRNPRGGGGWVQGWK